jgi:hypothetical protein
MDMIRYATYEFGLVKFFHNVRVSKAPFKLTPRVNIAAWGKEGIPRNVGITVCDAYSKERPLKGHDTNVCEVG